MEINIFKSSITSISINSSGNFLTISNIYLPWIIIDPSFSIIKSSLELILVWIVISLSLAVKVNLVFFKSNLIPAKTGIRFLVEIALLTLLSASNNNSLFFFFFIYIPYFFYIYNNTINRVEKVNKIRFSFNFNYSNKHIIVDKIIFFRFFKQLQYLFLTFL